MRLPMKSLVVGNRWVYRLYDYVFSSSQQRTFRVYEIVVGDTIVQGNRYTKVLSTFDNNIRYERATDSSIYVWSATNGEELFQAWTNDSVPALQSRPWTMFQASSLKATGLNGGDIMNRFENTFVKTDTSLFIGHTSSSPFFGSSIYRALGFERQRGLTRIIEDNNYRSFRNNTRKTGELIGSFVNGIAIGDTDLNPTFLLYSQDTTIIFDPAQIRKKIAFPLLWNNTFPERLFYNTYTATANIIYDTTFFEDIQFLDYQIENPLTDTIRPEQIKRIISRTNVGTSTSLRVGVPVPFSNVRGIWVLCTIKAPISDTIPGFTFTTDSVLYANLNNTENIRYGLQVKNGILRFQVPRVSLRSVLPTLQAKVGDTVRIPITITGLRARSVIDTSALPLSLSVNATMLEPIGQTPRGTVQSGIRVIPLRLPLQNGNDTVRTTLLFRATVGNDTATNVTLRIEPQSGVQYIPSIAQGFVRVLGNQAGGEQARFYSKSPRFIIAELRPNPITNNVLKCGIDVVENSVITVSLVNSLGQSVLQTTSILERGKREIALDVGGVPEGLYVLVMTSQGAVDTRKVQIRH